MVPAVWLTTAAYHAVQRMVDIAAKKPTITIADHKTFLKRSELCLEVFGQELRQDPKVEEADWILSDGSGFTVP